MSEEDPREELEEIIDLYDNDHMPEIAYQWAIDALETAESIVETIEEMQSKGLDAPTYSQEEALINIYNAACNWLRR